MLLKKGWKIKGIVQGVGFRFFALKKAKELSLKGYVKNLYDGSVEVCAYGEKSAIEKLEQDLYIGPPAAAVYAVESFEPSQKLEEMDGFEIQY
jgi:acylphosphatase